ncbi:hypothetical protein C7T35_30375 [Variovorax sp. WS11]|uniref:hypothetical protein n=1 Tax=Variovorax sp. WS11 TaxID=1105204 RepID=UPI000D0DEAD3|nr:hypothetical protein [Variovorax sp. WS11]NDZ13746.1 hypothetical protein [Variovorax sp. WS11]PSL80779.1 hypothetical protein C7T35_30375 [Variovorax sp. WS11]
MPANPFIADAARPGHLLCAPALALPAARMTVSVQQARLGQALDAAMQRFDADVRDVVAARGRAGSFASAATLIDIRAFGWKALERYGDEAAVLLDAGPAAPQAGFNDAEVARLLDAVTDHLMALNSNATGCLREAARAIDMSSLLPGLEDELFATLVRCAGRLATVLSARTAAPEAVAAPSAFEWLQATGRRWVRRLGDGRSFSR